MTQTQKQAIHVVGGGLAGSEAAWQIAAAGIPVVMHEMRPTKATAAHKTGGLAELVCSNSFRSDDRENADRSNRDERGDQGVLDQRLTFLALAQKLDEAEQDLTSLRC